VGLCIETRYLVGHSTGNSGKQGETNEGGEEIVSKKRNPRIGSSLDDFLKAEGILEELQVQAVKEVVAWQLEEAMKKKRLSKLLQA
jgi:hypothetical protein